METFESSVVPNNNNPTWTTTSSNSSSFSIPLHKKSVQQQQQHDGSGSSSSCTVMLHVNMKEDESAVDSFLPSPIRGGRMGLGQACLDINPLLFGEEGVMDVWLNLDAPQAAAASASASSFDDYSNDVPNNDIDNEGEYGKVRLLIAYEPRGFRPCKDDIVCMEAFARSNTNLILNPVAQPMKVLDTKGDYLLVQYHLPPDTNNATTSTNQTTTTTRRRRRRSVGTLRLHRNTLFVIERFTLVDGIWDLTMKPVDMIGSLGVVRWAGGVIGPYAGAVMDLAMPAILSSKLLFAAAKTAGSAGLFGIITATKVASAAAVRKRDGSDGVYDDRSSSSSRGVL